MEQEEICYGVYHYRERQIVEVDNLIVIDEIGLKEIVLGGYFEGTNVEEVLTCAKALVAGKNIPLMYKRVKIGVEDKVEMSLKQALENVFKQGALECGLNETKVEKVLDRKDFYTEDED